MDASPASLSAIARDVAMTVGEFLVDGRPENLEIATKSSPTDIVTAMDTAAEALIVEKLTEARPGDGILGEEGADLRGVTGVDWVIDPIDGTVNYLYDLPWWAVSVAARSEGRIVAGAVCVPSLGWVFTAVEGEGAFREVAGERTRLRASGCLDLGMALVATGFGYDRERREHQARVLAQVLPRIRDIRRAGAAAIDLCLVATGQVDAYFERGLQPWDLAAGGLIAREAGAVVAGLRGAEPGMAMVCASAPGIAAELTGMLEGLDADQGP